MDEKLDRIIDFMVKGFEKIDKRFDQIEQQYAEFRNQVWGRMDSVYKEVLAMRQEQAAHAGTHLRVNNSIHDHETRLKKLESSILTAHTIKK